jgi:hypothetical protein
MAAHRRMEGVNPRVAGLLVALLSVLALAAPAAAQDDDQDRPKAVDKVYRDYRDDGVIEACDHSRDALQRTLDDLPEEADVETPDLRPALEAAIEQVEDDECEEEEVEPAPTTTPPPAATPAPTAAPVPTTPPPSGGGDDDLGTTPLPGGGGGNEAPHGAGDVSPLPEVTPVPEATPAPPAAVPPADPTGPPPQPSYVNEDDPFPVSLLVLAGVLALVALLALLYAVLSRLGWAERPLSRVRRAGREAAFRAGGTWGDFADWIRVGR